MAAKPKPPPLDTDEAAAAATSDVPHAESGKATADDAAAAAAELAKLAASQPPASETPQPPAQPTGERAKAVLVDSAGVLYARPDPSAPISLTEAVVNGNFYCSYRGKPAHVKHGTPASGLPDELLEQINRSNPDAIRPLPPKQPPNPFAP